MTERRIVLTCGLVAVVDSGDYERFAGFRWNALRLKNAVYAKTRGGVSDGPQYLMHRMILGAERGQIVDHIDGNGLNNVRSNLRIASASQNAQNMRVSSGRLKGVSWHRRSNKWRAQIRIPSPTGGSGKMISLGSYIDPTEAALAYDHAAREHFGEFARVNFPRGVEQSAAQPVSIGGGS